MLTDGNEQESMSDSSDETSKRVRFAAFRILLRILSSGQVRF